MRDPRARAAVIALCLVSACAGLSACSSDDTPSAFCKSVTTLKSTVDTITATPLSLSGLSELPAQVDQLGTQLSDLKSNAKSEFAPQISAVETTGASFKSSAEATANQPTLSGLTTVKTNLTAFTAAVKKLFTDSTGSC